MNLAKFPVGSTNIFPIANSHAGGQLLTEFNLKSRESVATDPNVKYLIGPSYTHSIDDYSVTKVSSSIIRINPGRGVFNGHFVELLTPIDIDLTEVNAQIHQQESMSGTSDSSILRGAVCVGIRVMYSTEQTMAGSMLTEAHMEIDPDTGESATIIDEYYNGIHIVILPESKFKTPSQVPDDITKITAHLLLASFHFYDSSITDEIKQNAEKVVCLPAERIQNLSQALHGTFLTKDGIKPGSLYTLSGKGTNPDNADWCDSTDSLVIWDAKPSPVGVSKDGNTYGTIIKNNTVEEATFRYSAATDSVSLILPHKQVEGYQSDTQYFYYPDKYLRLASADYTQGTGGVVTRAYTNKIKDIQSRVDQFYSYMPNGKFKLYLETLNDRADLPRVSDITKWSPGDYVLVGQDTTVEVSEDRPPSTMYVVLPGLVSSFALVKSDAGRDYVTIPKHVINESGWYNVLSQLLRNQDWPAIIAEAESGSYINVISKAIRDTIEISDSRIDWVEVVNTALSQGSIDEISWPAEIQAIFDGGQEWFYRYIDTFRHANPAQWAVLENITDGYFGRGGQFDPYIEPGEASSIWDPDTGELLDSVKEALKAYYPKRMWVKYLISETDEGSHAAVDAGNQLRETLGHAIAHPDVSGINWQARIHEVLNRASDPSSIIWEDVIADAIVAANPQLVDQSTYRKYIGESIPASLSSGVCLWENTYPDELPTQSSLENDFVGEQRFRGIPGVDYFRAIVETDENFLVYYYKVTGSLAYTQELSPEPIWVTGGVSLATETSVGGFLNVPDSAIGNGYVYRDDEGYLRLLDYDLLATGVLAYQLGEDYTINIEDYSELQNELDEFVNNRVAFKTDGSDSATVPTINVNIQLSESDESHVINLHGIDSRFGTCVYVHISGTTTSTTVINIYDCEKIRLDINSLSGDPMINIYRSCIYYDRDVLNRMYEIQDMSLWYSRFTEEDANILVDGMKVMLVGAPVISSVYDDFWSEATTNDNHYIYALRSLEFSGSGDIVGCELYVGCSSSNTSEQTGTFIVRRPFYINQSVALPYPEKRITGSLKVTGAFVEAYHQGDHTHVNELSFTAVTDSYDYSVVKNSTIGGDITFLVKSSVVDNTLGINYESTDIVPGFEPGKLHIFSGGRVD